MKKMRFLFVLSVIFFFTDHLNAQSTFPVNDVSNPKEGCYAFINATIVTNAQTMLQNATLVIRKGKIEAVGIQIMEVKQHKKVAVFNGDNLSFYPLQKEPMDGTRPSGRKIMQLPHLL